MYILKGRELSDSESLSRNLLFVRILLIQLFFVNQELKNLTSLSYEDSPL